MPIKVNLKNTYHLNLNSDSVNQLKKTTKKIRFHLNFKKADSQDFIYTTISDGVKITNINLYLFVPVFLRKAETQAVFNESIRNNYTISFDICYTVKKLLMMC